MEKYSDPSDPKGLIFEAYRIPNISEQDCRTIFFDWALSLEFDRNPTLEIKKLYEKYGAIHELHPMTLVLQEGLEVMRRTGRRKKRRK